MSRSADGATGSGPAANAHAVPRPATLRARSGAIAGIASTVGFTAIHDLFISDIWHMLPIMAVAGALCGLCIAWSYRLLCERASVTGWLGYNLVYVTMLGLLAAASVVVLEPTTTLAAVLEANEPPTELILTAMPMTIAFALLAAATLSALPQGPVRRAHPWPRPTRGCPAGHWLCSRTRSVVCSTVDRRAQCMGSAGTPPPVHPRMCAIDTAPSMRRT